ncbi:MAG: DUF427 domain-containing protein [Gemmatimonadales bacterium]
MPWPAFRPSVEATPRWVRVRFGGEIIADSKRALLLRQYGPGGLPTYYFPQADVRMDLRAPTSTEPPAGDVAYWTVQVGDRIAENAAWTYLDPPAELAALREHVSFDWDRMDAWYEEEEEVFVHARDPHSRVDVLASSRHVRIAIAGQTVADTRRPYLLFETGLPTRYYIPRDDVGLDLLEPSKLTTRCPYKGIASYWSVNSGGRVAKNVVWSYADPIPECPKIRGLLCFFSERVDLYVDGELQTRPGTPWSE